MNYTDFFDAGLTDLIPIRRGEKRPTGRWTEIRASREEVESWQSGNLGLRTARFPVVDIDVKDPALAAALVALVGERFGPAPCRTGQAPKCAMLYELDGAPFPKKWIQFERGTESYRVEILAGGQYLVIAGKHPSGSDYTWDRPPHAAELPLLNAELADRCLQLVGELVVRHGYTVVSSKTQSAAEQAPPQEELTAPLADIVRAVRSIPNRASSFPDRESYLTFGFALKAALIEHPDEAYALWLEWGSRWDGGSNDEAILKRDWAGMAGPYRIGASYLFRLAKDLGGLNTAQDEFAPTTDELAPDLSANPLLPFTPAWLAHQFILQHGHEVRYSPQLGGWMRWDGTRWSNDTLSSAHHLIAVLGRAASHQALERIAKRREAESAARWCLNTHSVRDSLAYAAFSPEVAASVDAFDTHLWLLNTPAGVLNLRTGTMTDSDPGLMFTRVTGASPSAIPTPRWNAFLREATGGDLELEAYLQRLVGYTLTGSTREHVLAFLWGTGGNGKGVFLNTILRMLGGYGTVSAMDTFTASNTDRHPTELAALAGARLVTAQETQEGRQWDEAKVKSITGGDPVSARFMRQDLFTFQPQFKLLFAGNHRPHIVNLDEAMKRRFHLVPFTHVPTVVDPDLSEALLAELPGIMSWAVAGCAAWQAEGLNPPAAVTNATANYFSDEDPIGRWMAERTSPSGTVTGTRELYDDWARWCTENGESMGAMRGFSNALRMRGLESVRTNAARGFRLALPAVFAIPSITAKGPTNTTYVGETLDDLLPSARVMN